MEPKTIDTRIEMNPRWVQDPKDLKSATQTILRNLVALPWILSTVELKNDGFANLLPDETTRQRR